MCVHLREYAAPRENYTASSTASSTLYPRRSVLKEIFHIKPVDRQHPKYQQPRPVLTLMILRELHVALGCERVYYSSLRGVYRC